MTGISNIAKRFLAEFPMPIIPKIVGEPTRGSLIKIRVLISGNAAYVESNFREGRHGHLTLTMTVEDYLYHKGHTPPSYLDI